MLESPGLLLSPALGHGAANLKVRSISGGVCKRNPVTRPYVYRRPNLVKPSNCFQGSI